jgi:uncharacterized protein (TIGR03086 family)
VLSIPLVDVVEWHSRAVEQAARRIEQVTPDQLTLPTPCSEWDVRGLLNHMVGGNRRFAAVARGEEVPPPTGEYPDQLGDDPVGAYAESAKEIIAAFALPGALDRPFPVRVGDVPGQVAVSLRLIDTMVHLWDLGRATGEGESLDPDLVAEADRLARSLIGATVRGPGRPFGDEVHVPSDAPIEHRLVAFLGRQP